MKYDSATTEELNMYLKMYMELQEIHYRAVNNISSELAKKVFMRDMHDTVARWRSIVDECTAELLKRDSIIKEANP